MIAESPAFRKLHQKHPSGAKSESFLGLFRHCSPPRSRQRDGDPG